MLTKRGLYYIIFEDYTFIDCFWSKSLLLSVSHYWLFKIACFIWFMYHLSEKVSPKVFTFLWVNPGWPTGIFAHLTSATEVTKMSWMYYYYFFTSCSQGFLIFRPRWQMCFLCNYLIWKWEYYMTTPSVKQTGPCAGRRLRWSTIGQRTQAVCDAHQKAQKNLKQKKHGTSASQEISIHAAGV